MMTVTADARKRVMVRTAKPGDRFDVQVSGDGTVMLRPLVPKAEEVPVVKPIRTKEGLLGLVRIGGNHHRLGAQSQTEQREGDYAHSCAGRNVLGAHRQPQNA